MLAVAKEKHLEVAGENNCSECKSPYKNTVLLNLQPDVNRVAGNTVFLMLFSHHPSPLNSLGRTSFLLLLTLLDLALTQRITTGFADKSFSDSMHTKSFDFHESLCEMEDYAKRFEVRCPTNKNLKPKTKCAHFLSSIGESAYSLVEKLDLTRGMIFRHFKAVDLEPA